MTSNHVVPIKIYLLVFAALMIGTAATVGVASIDLGGLNIVVALSIAVIKATLVALFFMHLRYSNHLNWVFAGAAILWLVILIGLTMSDFLTRTWV